MGFLTAADFRPDDLPGLRCVSASFANGSDLAAQELTNRLDHQSSIGSLIADWNPAGVEPDFT